LGFGFGFFLVCLWRDVGDFGFVGRESGCDNDASLEVFWHLDLAFNFGHPADPGNC